MRKRIQILLILSISFLMSLFPAYLDYNYLIENDFSSPNPVFQNLDDENLLVEQQDKSIAFESCDLSNIRGALFPESLACLSFQTSALNRDTIVYRC
jgi:hypothetical protein